ncbi:hypothetical protein BJX66DRAFT_17231 [Aspergillus keveii]|uniref:C2H2 type zinc finger domain protein n=1 Tax=Aspergillus keveii TaxID=714993 RepID=A0ABR4FVB6_9EURO
MSSSLLPKPFACQYPGCNSRYQRREHLNRHEAQHRGGVVSACPFCGRTFRRGDTLRRHVRHDHADVELESVRAIQACEGCRVAKVRCRGGVPCEHCQAKNRECIFAQSASTESQPSQDVDDQEPIQEANDGDMDIETEHPPTSSADKIQHYVHLYFSHFHSHWPILHRHTFDIAHEPPFLVQAVIMVGLWVSGTASGREAAIELHLKLGQSILEQRSKWDRTYPEEQEQEGNEDTPASRWPIATYQGILIYLIFSLISSRARVECLDLTLSIPPSDRTILLALTGTCLRNNIFYYPRMLERYLGVNDITCIWVGVEEIKRLGLALYKVSRLCGDHSGSDQRDEDGRLLRLSDLRLPVPDSRHLWDAYSNAELSRLLQIDGGTRPGRLDGSQEANWISNFGQVIDTSMDFHWI